jgi:2-haloalkanoic acid dehalogenase type II
MRKRLSDFKVLTFDCYGTLIDWETGIWDALQALIMANGRDDLLRQDALRSFARHESAIEKKQADLPYPMILRQVHAALAEEFGLESTSGLDEGFSQSLSHWPAFPDTADALRCLKKYFKLVILSNIDREGIAASQRKLGVGFDAVYTAQDIGSYKPSQANFRYMLDRLQTDFGLRPGDVLHTAQSLYHDHQPARELGLANAWIDRQKLSKQGDWGATAPMEKRPKVDFSYFTMAEMAKAVRAEIQMGGK